jgi:hypothetical protein
MAGAGLVLCRFGGCSPLVAVGVFSFFAAIMSENVGMGFASWENLAQLEH